MVVAAVVAAVTNRCDLQLHFKHPGHYRFIVPRFTFIFTFDKASYHIQIRKSAVYGLCKIDCGEIRTAKLSIPYLIPAQTTSIQTGVAKSKFSATIYHADSVEAARATLAAHRTTHPEASHHVYAFRVGSGNSVIEGLSDDGEPTGTSGPPVMNVLRGSLLGDVLIVVSRIFGGTLLGTGGLVRAYSEAAALVIKACPTTLKVEYRRLMILIEYPVFTLFKRMLPKYDAEITSESFSSSIELEITIPTLQTEGFIAQLTEMTAGEAYIEALGPA